MKLSPNPILFIVDKSEVYRKIVKNCLLALNYCCVFDFETIEESAECRYSPDILILEQVNNQNTLPVKDFIQKHNSRYKNTRFIFLSSNTNIEEAVSAIRWGAYDYIVKSKKGLERLVLKIDKLVASYKVKQKKKMQFNIMLASLGMVSALLILAVLQYNYHLF